MLDGVGDCADRPGRARRLFRASRVLRACLAGLVTGLVTAWIIAPRFLPAGLLMARFAPALLLASRFMTLALLRRTLWRWRWRRGRSWRGGVVEIRRWLGFGFDLGSLRAGFDSLQVGNGARIFLALAMVVLGFGTGFAGVIFRAGRGVLDGCRSDRCRCCLRGSRRLVRGWASRTTASAATTAVSAARTRRLRRTFLGVFAGGGLGRRWLVVFVVSHLGA